MYVFVDCQFMVKFIKDGVYKISCDDGNTWYSVEGDLIKSGDKTVVNASINSIKFKYSIFRNEDILALFTKVCIFLISIGYFFFIEILGWKDRVQHTTAQFFKSGG